MKTRKDFMMMKPLDIFLYNGTYKTKNDDYEKQLEVCKKEMEKYCFNKPNKQKFEIAKQKYDETLSKKADNMQDWLLCQKVANQRKINLHSYSLKIRELN